MGNWIEELKVGDNVVLHGDYGKMAIKQVEAITKAGNIKVAGVLFNTDGWQRTSNIWCKVCIHEYTEEKEKEIINNVTKQKAKLIMRKFCDSNREISITTAQKIIELLIAEEIKC